MPRMKNVINDSSLWQGLGDNFSSFTQVINELVDNSISSYLYNKNIKPKDITIKIIQKNDKYCFVKVADNAGGISNFNRAFSVGNNKKHETPLNEHGFGLKNALSSANSNGMNWKVLTKRNSKSKYYIEINAPYKTYGQGASYEKYGQDYNFVLNDSVFSKGTGTIVEFTTPLNLIRTVVKGLRIDNPELKDIAPVIVENLGYYYAPLLKDSGIQIKLEYEDLKMTSLKTLNVNPITPKYCSNLLKSPNKSIGICKGKNIEDALSNSQNNSYSSSDMVKVKYEFLSLNKKNSYYCHYLRNMKTSGVEIRLNGRLLKDNVFTDIWHKQQHNSYNSLLIRIDVLSSDSSKLPKTYTNKSNILPNDDGLIAIFNFIRSKLPYDKLPQRFDKKKSLSKLCKKENDYYKAKGINARASLNVKGFQGKVKTDLFKFCNNKITIYEGTNKVNLDNIYNLYLHWDSLKYDGYKINDAYIIMNDCSEIVKKLFINKNAHSAKKNNYNIKFITWNEIFKKY